MSQGRDSKLRNTRAFVKSYLGGKTGSYLLSRGYGRRFNKETQEYQETAPKQIAHAFKEALR